jgi:DNA adenine methylase
VEQATSQYDWKFVCDDFRKIIPGAKQGDFIYCDPPYIGRHVDYFNSWSEDDEQELYDLLSAVSAKFILSTWHSNRYRKNSAIEKYAYRFTILTREHFYHVGASEENRNPMLEAIVLNYNPLLPLELEVEKQLALFDKADPKKRYVIQRPTKS